MAENKIVGSVFVDEHGNEVEIVDDAARAGVAANAEGIAKNQAEIEKNAKDVASLNDDVVKLTWDNLGRKSVPVLTNVDNFTATFTGSGDTNTTTAKPEVTVDTVISGPADYLVTFDGEEYVVSAKQIPGVSGVFLGSPYVFGNQYEDTGEPFCTQTMGTRTFNLYTRTPGEHTFKIQRLGEGIVTVPEDYIPDTIARVSQLGGGGATSLEDLLMTDVVIMEPMSLGFTEMEGIYLHQADHLTFDRQLSAGDILTVEWDGTKYETEVGYYEDMPFPYAGNLALFGMPDADNGLPFLIVQEDVFMIGTAEAGTHDVSIVGKVGITIPNKHLSPSVQTEREIAEFYFHYNTNTGKVEALFDDAYNEIRNAFLAQKIAIAHVSSFYNENGANGGCVTLIGQEAYAGTAIFSGLSYGSFGVYGNVSLSVSSDGNVALGRTPLYLTSAESNKVFKILVNDSGVLSAEQVTI